LVDIQANTGAIPIPITRARTGPITTSPIDTRSNAVLAVARPQALIVDDCRFIAERLARALEARGFECMIAGDGLAGLKLVRLCRFDLFVLDVDMPFADGFAVLRQLRCDAVHAHTPVLMLAAERSEADQARAMEMGASGYMTKPLQLRPLNAMIDAMMR
jgi:DNA-binding response OmpR family regulator